MFLKIGIVHGSIFSVLVHQPVRCVVEEGHQGDADDARNHADPSQSSPAADAVADPEDDQHSDRKKQRLKDSKTSTKTEVNAFRNVNA